MIHEMIEIDLPHNLLIREWRTDENTGQVEFNGYHLCLRIKTFLMEDGKSPFIFEEYNNGYHDCEIKAKGQPEDILLMRMYFGF